MHENTPRNRFMPCRPRTLAFAALALSALSLPAWTQQSPRVVEILADHDSRYKMQGKSTPSITVTAGEKIRLRVIAIRAKNRNKDGSIHGFSLLRPKDHKPVPGWELLFKPGTQEFELTAPEEPGEYQVVCTVICSENHEGMTMKFFVEPKASQESEVRK
jgi:heme/copper-type cytochrome/quinol oxidase subunit 2